MTDTLLVTIASVRRPERPKLPLVPGHQIVAEVAEAGERFAAGDRVGVPWLGWACGECAYCRSGRENLCPRARFTGRDIDGGYAEYTCVGAAASMSLAPRPAFIIATRRWRTVDNMSNCACRSAFVCMGPVPGMILVWSFTI